VCSEGAFIGQDVGGEGGQEVARTGALATCDEQHRARRPCARAGRAWSRRRGTVGRLWRAPAGRRRAERRETERGGPGGSFSSPPRLTVWVGSEGAGLDRGGLHEHDYRARANGNSDDHSSFDFLDFCPPRVRSNARKNSNFKFLKTATVVRQHIGQGFQGYFCYKELSCFGKICI
jgi:hypothetical protein